MIGNNPPVNGNQTEQQQTQVNITPKLEFQKCRNHQDKDLELFCKTCSTKICVSCAYSRDREHKGHDIDQIENLQLEMLQKAELYEENKEKLKDFRIRLETFIDEKVKPFQEKMKETQRNEEIQRLKTWFLINHFIESQKMNIQKKMKETIISEKTLESVVQDYRTTTSKGLKRTATETLENIKSKFEDGNLETISNESKAVIEGQSETLENELKKIYSQESVNALKLTSCFSVSIHENNLIMQSGALPLSKGLELNLDELIGVSSIEIHCSSRNMIEEDWNLLKLILLSLESLNSVKLVDNGSSFVLETITGEREESFFKLLQQCFHLAKNCSLNQIKTFSLTLNSVDIEYQDMDVLLVSLIPAMNSIELFELNHSDLNDCSKKWHLRFLPLLFERETLKDAQISLPFIEMNKSQLKVLKEKIIGLSSDQRQSIKLKNFDSLSFNIKQGDVLEKPQGSETAPKILPQKQNQQPVLFGVGSQTDLKNQPPPTKGIFGSNTTGGMFGLGSQTDLKNQPPPAIPAIGLFVLENQTDSKNQPPSAKGMFGSSPSGGLFGLGKQTDLKDQSSPAKGIFGSSPAGGLFGLGTQTDLKNQPHPATGIFGSTSSGGLFPLRSQPAPKNNRE